MMSPIETVWIILYSSSALAIVVTILAGGFYTLGLTIHSLIRLPKTEHSSIAIATGLATTTFTGWYAYRVGIPLNILIPIIFFTALVLFLLFTRKHGFLGTFKQRHSIYFLPVIALALSAQAVITFNFSENPIGTLGNNDIYDWSTLANYLLGLPGYDNVITISGGSAQQYRIDSFGTFFILAMFAKFCGTLPLEAATVFTLFCMSLIALSIFDIVKSAFYFKDSISAGIALLVAAGSFFFYLAYHAFYGQLLATLFYLTTLASLLHIWILSTKHQPLNFIQRSALPLFSLLGILLTYQSGFLVFAVFAIIFSSIHAVVVYLHRDEGKASRILPRMQLLLFPLSFGISIALALLPELSWHTVQRTLTVKDALNGWPLPLISPKYLLSIPSLRAFPSSSGNIAKYIVFLSAAAPVFLFAYLKTVKQSNEIASRYLVLSLLFVASLFAYLLAFTIKGDVYQVWKFASFVVLPTSFMFYASCILLIQDSKVLDGLLKKLLLPIIIIGCIYVVIVSPSRLKLESISYKIEQMKISKDKLLNSEINNVVLSDMTYGETMMAFNILSKDFKLYPKVQSYVQPVDDSVVQQLNTDNTRALVSSKCYVTHDNQGNDGEYKIIRLDEMQVGNSKHLFGALCPNSTVILLDGFSDRELWGVWTVGNKAQMRIEIPTTLQGKHLNITFSVQPFGSQNVTAEVDGYSENWSIEQDTRITLTIPPDITNQKQLLLSFHIDNPQSPSSIDPVSTDTRLLGIGFTRLVITAKN